MSQIIAYQDHCWVTRYPMIFKTESGRAGYRKKYRVSGRIREPVDTDAGVLDCL